MGTPILSQTNLAPALIGSFNLVMLLIKIFDYNLFTFLVSILGIFFPVLVPVRW